jgi:hypothetical protein
MNSLELAVELAPNVDAEAIIVANQCLTDSFQLQGSSSNEAEPDLISLFRQAGYDATMEVAEDTAKDYAPQPSTTSSEVIHEVTIQSSIFPSSCYVCQLD